MQSLVLAYDGNDDKGLDRRLAARPAHMAGIEKMKAEKKALYGAAILAESEKMIGSVMIVDFKTRTELDAWLKSEPYVAQRVWQKIEISPCKVPPLFSAEGPSNDGNIDGFVKSPSAALRFTFVAAAYLISTPHSSGFARLASEPFYAAIAWATFYETINIR